MRKRPAQLKFQKLGDVLQEVLKKRDILLTSEKRRLQEIWNRSVGDRIAAQTTPDRLQKGSLYVKVSNSVWMQQLHFLKKEIIDTVNRQMGEQLIKNIFFSIGEIPHATRIPRDPASFLPATFPLKGKDKKMIEQYTTSVSDQELKEILKRVLTKDIIRRRLGGTR